VDPEGYGMNYHINKAGYKLIKDFLRTNPPIISNRSRMDRRTAKTPSASLFWMKMYRARDTGTIFWASAPGTAIWWIGGIGYATVIKTGRQRALREPADRETLLVEI
jgi:hypothetical protein